MLHVCRIQECLELNPFDGVQESGVRMIADGVVEEYIEAIHILIAKIVDVFHRWPNLLNNRSHSAIRVPFRTNK